MRPWLRRTLLVSGVFALCWCGAVIYWQGSKHVPTGVDLAGVMLALPLLLLTGLWFGQKLIEAAPAPEPAAAAPLDSVAAAAATPAAPLFIAASALHMPGAESGPQLAAAMQDKLQRPQLDPELLDADGYPILSARAESVDETGQQELMDDWLAAHPAEKIDGEPVRFDTEHLRALALGAGVLVELVREATQHDGLTAYMTTPQAAARAASSLPTLQLHLLLPNNWSAQQRRLGAAWLYQQAGEQGWPAEKLSLQLAPDGHPFALIDQLASHNAHGVSGVPGVPFLALVLACDSYIGELAVGDWIAQGRLFGAAHSGGQIPGEGAAGLLLADAAQAAHLPASSAPILLHRASTALRAQSADGRGHGDTNLLAELGKQALAAANLAPAAVTQVCADSDQRSSRMIELMNSAGTLLPGLDLSLDVLGVAAACGESGHVGALAALVLAHHEAADNAGQVLCISNLDPFQRGAVVVAPAA